VLSECSDHRVAHVIRGEIWKEFSPAERQLLEFQGIPSLDVSGSRERVSYGYSSLFHRIATYPQCTCFQILSRIQQFQQTIGDTEETVLLENPFVEKAPHKSPTTFQPLRLIGESRWVVLS